MVDFREDQQDALKLRGQTNSGAAGGADQLSLQPGKMIADRYRVVRLIGQGAMGSVYEVEQIALRKRFALKTLNSLAASAVATRRFQKEAQAASRLDHPNLVMPEKVRADFM